MIVRARALRVLPESRSECREGSRPCPLVSCRFHLLLDVSTDRPRVSFARAFDEASEESIADALRSMPETCALDVADRGGMTFEAIGELLDMTRQSVEQVQLRALARIRDDKHDLEDPEHPEDFYIRYSNMGADELAEIAAQLRARGRTK